MFFKKIEMHGFKSFAEPVVIEFNKGITCIVGPNGSGKSNISDAIRWVLGEQSPKMLRGGKMEEVIFSGTSNRKSRGMAEVTLVIDNEDGSLPIDYKEVAITRRMFRSGESEYHINGNQCRLRDIRELIMDTGIGVDGYSIIGQGKISDILSNKTESRREIFEEAAGIVLYRTKKDESEKKLAATSDNMERIQDIIGEIESRIDGLKEDSIKAEEFIGLRDRNKELEINITLKNIESLELKDEYFKDDIMELEVLIQNTDEEKEEIQKKLSELNDRNETLEVIANESNQKLLVAIDELNTAVNKEEVDRERMSAIEENTDRIQNELKLLEEKKESEAKHRTEYQEKTSALDKKQTEVNQALREKVEIYNSMSEEMASLMQKADSCRNDVFELSSKVNSSKAEISSLERLHETLSKRQEALLEEKSSGEDSNKETLDRLNNIKTEKNDATESLEEITDRITAKRQEYIAKQQEERRLAKESEELRITLGRVSARKKTIEEMESNYEGYNFAVKHVMKSGLKGIHGVVADLIKVPAGYETAMETALGAALQNIVCEDDDSAKIAINSLKQHKAGRMTFLPVKSVTGRAVRENHLKSETGFIGFGPDCLNYDSKYENIINYLLGRVIIVDSMDNAVRISKKAAGYRFVTLEGEVINAGGAITGGKYKNKTANILDRKAEITALENEIKEKEHRHNETDKALAELRNELAQFTDKLQALENEKRKYEHDLIALNNEIRLTENILKEIKSGGDKLAKELEHIKAEKENSQNMVKELEAKIIDAQQRIVEAEQASEEAMNLYNEKKADFENINEDITQARIAVNNCDNEKAHAETMLRRINATIEEIDKDSETKRMQLNELFNEKQAITEGHGDIGSLIKQKENEKQELEEYLKDVTEEKAEIGATVIKLNAEKEAVSSKLESSRNQKYELEVKKAKNETQLDTFKDKLWEDYEISYIQAMEFKSEDFNMAAAVKENRQIRSRMKELGDVNVNAIEEYKSVKERYEFLTNERADIQEAMDALNKIIGDMDNTIKTKFKDSFDRIVINFEEKFKELFGGGHAELRLSDENDPLQASIDIVAQPPGKKLQNINLLSGGEKTLTAIALMFAVLKAKPTPFCILDEVEAPLDDANIDRFMHSLRKFAGIQFTLVTHQKATMEQADVLYGVTMPEKGVSKVLSLNLGDDFEI